jgi:hypothetical protein
MILTVTVTGPYGTGNMSFGNFDFDPAFYPTPAQFIANLSAYGFDLQVTTYYSFASNCILIQTDLGCEPRFLGHRTI